MINWFAVIAGLAYVGAGVRSFSEGHVSMGFMWVCYAVANGCLTWSEMHIAT